MSIVVHADYTFLTDAFTDLVDTFDVRSPANDQVVARVPDCGAQEAQKAIKQAKQALLTWKNTHPYERATILRKWFDLMLKHQAQLAQLMALEMGKPITEAQGEVRYAASFLEWYAEEARRITGEQVLSSFKHKRGSVRYEPLGVCYAITPWNFPAAMITRKAGPALAAGCVMVIKPAEQSPLTAMYLQQLWQQADGPEGTLQVLPSSRPAEVSAPFFADPAVKKLSFTGSTEVGRALYVQAAHTIKRVSLELGGHAPFLIFEDAEVEQAAREVVISKFRNAGQTCICTNRIYVHEGVASAFTEAFVRITKNLKLGDPLDPNTEVGPLVDRAGLHKVQAHVDDAVSKGAAVATGGRVRHGLFFEPTVLTGVVPGMRILEEETFGPVAPITVFTEEDEAICAANDTPFGLAAFAWTNDLRRSHRLAESLEYGMVGINDGVPSAMAPYAPFGGMKSSGIGREGGPWGLAEYLEPKFVSIGLQ